MKAVRALSLAGFLFCAVARLVGAAGFSLEVGAVGYDFNALGSTQGSGVITNGADFAPDVYLNGSYTVSFDKDTKLKLGLMAEDMMGTIAPSFVQIGRVEPYADFTLGQLTARVSFPVYLLGYDTTNDPASAEIKYILDKIYKGISLSTYYNSSNAFLFTTYESVAYRLNLDKTTAFVFSVSTEIGLFPTPWLDDLKPQVTVLLGPVQLDLKESIYFGNQNRNPTASDVKFNLRFFTDPRLTFNFASIGVPGLKLYLAASLYTWNTYPNSTLANDAAFYGNATTGTGAQAMALGSSVTPGVSYAIGPFFAELALKYSNYDDSVGNAAKKDPTFDPSLKLSYTLSL
jgi:hypothetical protein